jgi:hypothetical protein
MVSLPAGSASSRGVVPSEPRSRRLAKISAPDGSDVTRTSARCGRSFSIAAAMVVRSAGGASFRSISDQARNASS